LHKRFSPNSSRIDDNCHLTATLTCLFVLVQVLVVEDEAGNIVREATKDTEVIAQYKTMREALVYLTHLDPEDTESIMLDKLSLQVRMVGSCMPHRVTCRVVYAAPSRK
jgi:hypothetical protein